MSGFMGDVARDALAQLRAAERERDAALDRETLARDELAEVHRVADSFLADEREERAMAEADLRDQLEQARGIAVALEQQNAAAQQVAGETLRATKPREPMGRHPSDCHTFHIACLAQRVVDALNPVAAELDHGPDGAAS